MPRADYQQCEAMREVCQVLFGRNNLIPGDFANMEVVEIDQTDAGNAPSGSGKRISFEIANDSIGKVMDDELSDNLDVLLRQAAADDSPAQGCCGS